MSENNSGPGYVGAILDSIGIGFKWQRENGSWVNKKEIREQLYKHQDGKCFYCKRKMSLNIKRNGMPARDFATFEHIERKQDGGKFNEANTVLACRKCNTQREIVRQSDNGKKRPKNMKPEKWKEILEKWKQHMEGCQSGRLGRPAKTLMG